MADVGQVHRAPRTVGAARGGDRGAASFLLRWLGRAGARARVVCGRVSTPGARSAQMKRFFAAFVIGLFLAACAGPSAPGPNEEQRRRSAQALHRYYDALAATIRDLDDGK